jgi:signal transduction histidine kinase/CheY-like chemotaxis protein
MVEYPESFSKLIFGLHALTRKLIASLDYENFLLQLIKFVLKEGKGDVVVAFLEEKQDYLYFSSRGDIDKRVEQEILTKIKSLYFKLKNKKISVELKKDILHLTGSKIEKIESNFFLPLFGKEKGEIIGLIYFGAQEKNAFDPEDIQFYYALAEYISFALSLLKDLLDEESKRLKVIFSELPYGVVLFEEGGKIIVNNELGEKLLTLFCKRDMEKCYQSIGPYSWDFLLSRGEQGVELEAEEKVFVRIKCKEVIYRQKKAYLVVLEDISRAKEVEKQMIGQERLAAVGKLAAGIAHDFNNILNIIMGYAELVKRDSNLSSKSYERLNVLVEQSERAAALIRQILDFSRKSMLNRSLLSLVSFIKEQVKFFQRIFPANIQFKLQILEENLIVKADLASLQQVINNIVINSRDAMPEGGTITITLDRVETTDQERLHYIMPGGKWAKIEIMDTGKGIPQEVLPHIFEPFFTTKEVGQGTGLGLAQAYGVIKQHDGFIFARSKEGQGTVMTIYLPLYEKKEPRSEELKEEAIIQGQGELVLVVDDDPDFLDFLALLLKDLNFETITAQDATEAMDKFLRYQKQISLVISDLVLPDQSGLDFLSKVLLLKPDLKTLLISGYASPEIKDPELKEKIYFLSKPFGLKTISFVLRKILLNP